MRDQGHPRFGYFDQPVTTMGLTGLSQLKAGKLPKRFYFAGVLGPEVCLSVGIVHLGYLARGFLKIFDLRTGTQRPVVERGFLIPGALGVRFDDNPDRAHATAAMPGYGAVAMRIEENSLIVEADIRRTKVELELKLGVAPLRVCTRTGLAGWNYTEKCAGLEVKRAKISGEDWGPETVLLSEELTGVTDWTFGMLRLETFWQWACFAGKLEDGRRIAGNLTVGINETGFTDNALWIDGKRELLAATAIEFNPERISEDLWTIRDAQGKLGLTARPLRFSLDETNLGVLKSRFHQGVGEFSGEIKSYGKLASTFGFLENFEARW